MQSSKQTDDQNKVWELIKDIHVALLVTHGEDDRLHARPMAAMSEKFDGTLWFFTDAGSPKIAEIEANPNVILTYSHPSKQTYVSAQGTAEVQNDRAKIAALWSEPARIWFPKGKDDPSIRLVKVTVERAEYWDGPASALVLLYDYAKARITKERPHVGQNRKVAF